MFTISTAFSQVKVITNSDSIAEYLQKTISDYISPMSLTMIRGQITTPIKGDISEHGNWYAKKDFSNGNIEYISERLNVRKYIYLSKQNNCFVLLRSIPVRTNG